MSETNQKQALAWIVGVSMGYGHQRTAYTLKEFSPDKKFINANDYSDIPKKDRNIWEGSRRFYEFISNFYNLPLIGKIGFSIFDYFQRIPQFYPKRNISKADFVLRHIYYLIKNGWGRHLIEKLNNENKKIGKKIPLISTFFTPAFMAEMHSYQGEIFCVVCDSDISRTWAPLIPSQSRIKYFAPTERVAERLKLYGLKDDNIFLTGYPLPIENIGHENSDVLKEDMKNRIFNLDPQKKYISKYQRLIETELGLIPQRSNHLLSLMFAIGGAGAQKEIATDIIKGLKAEILNNKIKILISVGVKPIVKDFIEKKLKKLQLYQHQNIEIISGVNLYDYFNNFNQALRKTDILWTKPSELSFYTALGLPIILAPTIGSQEDFNRDWLLKLGSALPQENIRYVNQWLFDYLKEGFFAEAAMQGFVEGNKMGVINIKKIIELCCG